jgi:hypothetical protein
MFSRLPGAGTAYQAEALLSGGFLPGVPAVPAARAGKAMLTGWGGLR